MSYSKLNLAIQNSATSDIARPKVIPYVATHTSTEKDLEKEVKAATGGVAVELGTYTTCDYVIVWNDDASIIVTLTYRTGAGAATTQSVALAGKRFVVLTDVTPANDLTLTSASGTPLCIVTILGT